MTTTTSRNVVELDQPWAMTQPALSSLIERVRADVRSAPTASQGSSRRGSIVILPIMGTILQRGGGLLDEFLGGAMASAERIGRDVQRLAADPGVEAIILLIDSPGGSVYGISELSDVLFAARRTKPIIAQVDSRADSAAFWLASQASQIVVTPGGEVGSIGIIAAHEDLTQMAAMMGVKVTVFTSGKFKSEGHPMEPLTPGAKDAIQAQLDVYYGMFLGAVARGRGVSVATVERSYGQGRVVLAKEALRLGMVDRVGTMAETTDRLVRAPAPSLRAMAAAASVGDPAIENAMRAWELIAVAGGDSAGALAARAAAHQARYPYADPAREEAAAQREIESERWKYVKLGAGK